MTAQFCLYEVKTYHALNSLWSTDSIYVWGNYWYVNIGMYKHMENDPEQSTI